MDFAKMHSRNNMNGMAKKIWWFCFVLGCVIFLLQLIEVGKPAHWPWYAPLAAALAPVPLMVVLIVTGFILKKMVALKNWVVKLFKPKAK